MSIVWAGGLSTLCDSCGLACPQRVVKTFPGPGYFPTEDVVVWLWSPLVNLYIWLTISSSYRLISFALGLIVRDGGLSTLCHSLGFACRQKVVKTFLGPGYLHSKDGVVWMWYPLVNLYIWLTISTCYGSIRLAWGLMWRDGGLSTICHSCWLACQHSMPKTFPGHGYLHSKYRVVWLWHPLVYL